MFIWDVEQIRGYWEILALWEQRTRDRKAIRAAVLAVLDGYEQYQPVALTPLEHLAVWLVMKRLADAY